MNKVTVQIYLGQQWWDAAEITFLAPEKGHVGPSRLDYLAPYVIQHLGSDTIDSARISCRYPVDFSTHSESHWPAFLLDLLPGGEGRRRWAERLGVNTGISGEWALLQHATANPAGNLRIKEAAASPLRLAVHFPDEAGELTEPTQHLGFSRESIVSKQEHFIEYAYQLGAAVAGATDVQGEAPKFLLVEDHDQQWHAESAIPDTRVKKHWIVKFARGNSNADHQILRNEAPYLEVARTFGLHVGEALQYQQGALFIPRFDRIQNGTKTERWAMESLYSAAGIAEFGNPTSHEVLASALMEHIAAEDRASAALEYIKRDLLNVIMGNTDNHGRNTALLRNMNGHLVLSPLYDFAPMYLDPEGIARVTRWGQDKEHAGRPNWESVIDFFGTWVDTDWLSEHLAKSIPALRKLTDTMIAVGIDSTIVTRCQPSATVNLQQLLALTH